MVLPLLNTERETWKEEDQGKHVRAVWGTDFMVCDCFNLLAAGGELIAAVIYPR